MKYIYTYLCCLVSILVIGQERWSEPVWDSTRGAISYKKCAPHGIRHVKIVYTLTGYSYNLGEGSRQKKEIRAVVTLTTSGMTYTRTVSTPTVTYFSKDPDHGTVVIGSDGGHLVPDFLSSGINSNTMTAMSYTAFPITNFTFSVASPIVDAGNPNGELPATFIYNSVTYSVPVKYQITGAAIRFHIPRMLYATQTSAGTSTNIAIEARQMTYTLALTTMPAATNYTVPASTFTMAARAYTLAPQAAHNTSDTMYRAMYETCLFRAVGHPGLLYLSGGAMPLLSNRQVLVSTPGLKNDAIINNSKYKENAVYGMGYEFKLGFRIKRNHIIYANAMYWEHGFKTSYNQMNPFTGDKAAAYKATEYKVSSLAFGLGYSYNNYIPGRVCNFTSELGLYSSTDADTMNTSVGSSNLRVGFKAAAGLSLKPNYRCDFKLMPVFLYDFTAYTKNTISTRFYSVGLMVSFGISLGNYK